jgi:two-component system LytT family response regulator
MTRISCVIIEDESKVRAVFRNLLDKFCPEIEVIGEAADITEGYQLIESKKPQLVFLDIEMPGGNGFELLAKFPEPCFETVFVTSYGHYAIKAIKFSAVDYLLKPVMIADLLLLTDKVKEKLKVRDQVSKYKLLLQNLDAANTHKLAINTKTKLEYIDLSEIVYLKADGNYTTIHMAGKVKYYVAKTLKEYEDMLCGDDAKDFIRIHKTYIINPVHIKHLDKADGTYVIMQDLSRLEVSRRKKQELMNRLQLYPGQ